MSYWTERLPYANPLAKNHQYRDLLETHLRRHLPELYEELKQSGDLQAYMTVRTSDAINAEEDDSPYEEVMEILLPPVPSEADHPMSYELDAAADDLVQAMETLLELHHKQAEKRPSDES